MNKGLFGALLIFVLLHCLLILVQPLLPFVDVPVHLADATVYRHFGEDTNAFSHFFNLRQELRPNVFHIHFIANAIFPSVETGAKVFYCLYILLLVFSIYLFIKAVGGNESFALLGPLLIYNVNSSYGFMAMSLSLPLVVCFLLLAAKVYEGDKWWQYCLLSLGLTLFFFIHIISTGFVLFILGLHLLWAQRSSFKHLVCCSLTLVPATALSFYWYITRDFAYKVVAGNVSRGMWRQSFVSDIVSRFLRWPFVDFVEVVGIPLTLLICGLLILALLKNLRATRETQGQTLRSKGLELIIPFIGASFLWHFLSPHKISGEVWISPRFSSFFLLGLLVLLSRMKIGATPKGSKIFFGFLALLHLVSVFHYFQTFQAACHGFDASLFPKGGKVRLAGMMINDTVRVLPIFLHYADYYTVWKQGVAASLIVDGANGTAVRKVDEKELPQRWRKDEEPVWQVPTASLECILVRGEVSPEQVKFMQQFKVVRRQGPWSLWQKQGPW